MKRKRAIDLDSESTGSDRLLNRCMNPFTGYEKRHVFNCIAKCQHMLHSNNKNKEERCEGWKLVSSEFNKICAIRRTVNQVRKFWANFKLKLKNHLKSYGVEKTETKLTSVEKEAICLFESDFLFNAIDSDELKSNLVKIKEILVSKGPFYDTKDSITEIVLDESDSFYSLEEEEEPFDENPLEVETKDKRSMDEQISLQNKSVNETSNFPGNRSFNNTQDNENSQVIPVPDIVRRQIEKTALQADTFDNPLCLEENFCNSDFPISHLSNMFPNSNVENIEEEPQLPSIVKVESLSTVNSTNNTKSMVYLPQSSFANSFQVNSDRMEGSDKNKINGHVNYPSNTFFLVRKSVTNPAVNPTVDPALEKETFTVKKQLLLRQIEMEEAKHTCQMKNLELEKELLEERHRMEIQILQRKLELANAQLNNFNSSTPTLTPYQ